MSLNSISGPTLPTEQARNLLVVSQQNLQPGNQSSVISGSAGTPGNSQANSVSTASNSIEDIKSAVKKVQDFVKQSATDLSFSIDEESGERVVKVIDRSSKEVIRQIPSEEMLQIAHALDKLQGILLKQKA